MSRTWIATVLNLMNTAFAVDAFRVGKGMVTERANASGLGGV